MTDPILDIVGIGFGPANLAAAVAMDDLKFSGTSQYFEKRASFAWQPDMMLRGSDIQHHPLRDLITPVNPLSQYGFVNYLHQTDRFFEFLNLGLAFPLRLEFASYVEWVAKHFVDQVDFGAEVSDIDIVKHSDGTSLAQVTRNDGSQCLARNAVIGPGRSRNIPKQFKSVLGKKVFHLMDYLPRIKAVHAPQRIAVIGGSQSAVEIMLDLDSRFPNASIDGISRKFGYRLKDTSPFTGEVYFPEFTDYYHGASWESRLALSAELRGTNYASADADVLNQLYQRRYESRLEGHRDHLTFLGSSVVESARDTPEGVELIVQDRHNGMRRVMHYDAIILATGFLDFGTGGQRELVPPLLQNLKAHFAFDPQHGFDVDRDYSLIGAPEMPGIYLNGLCESTHGFGDAGSFSLLSLRANEIAKSIADRMGQTVTDQTSSDIQMMVQAAE